MNGNTSKEEYHAWRSFTAHFLEKAYRNQTPWDQGFKLRDSFEEILVELLTRYSNSKGGPRVSNEVKSIVHQAVTLAKLMAKCRTHWQCIIPKCSKTDLPYNFKYRQVDMKVEEWLPGGRRNDVDLVVRPMMIKSGDRVNGEERYDLHAVKKKARVLVCLGAKARPKEEDPDSEYTG